MARASTDFIKDVAHDESLRFIEENPKLRSMAQRQKNFVRKRRLMTERIVDRFFADLSKRASVGANIKTEICFVTCGDCKKE